jgi:hypothetical protein
MIKKKNDAYDRQTLRVDCCGWESYREAVSYIIRHITERPILCLCNSAKVLPLAEPMKNTACSALTTCATGHGIYLALLS